MLQAGTLGRAQFEAGPVARLLPGRRGAGIKLRGSRPIVVITLFTIVAAVGFAVSDPSPHDPDEPRRESGTPIARTEPGGTPYSAHVVAPAPLAPATVSEATTAEEPLSLSGVVTLGGRFAALIMVDGRAADIYVEGSVLGRHGVLKAIQPDQIVVEKNGAVHSIRISASRNANGSADALGVTDADGSVVGSVPLSYPPGPLPASLGGVASDSYVLSRADLQSSLMPWKVLGEAKMAVYPGGGFQFVEVREGSLLDKLGIQPGDVVRSINDRQLMALADVLAMQNTLPDAEWVKVEIMRDGQLQTWEQKIRN